VHHGMSRVRSEPPRVLHPRPNAGQHGAGHHERHSASGRHARSVLHFPAAGGTRRARGRRYSGERYASLCIAMHRYASAFSSPFYALTLALILALGPTSSSPPPPPLLPPPPPPPQPQPQPPCLRHHPHPHLHPRPHPDQVVAPVVAQPAVAVGQPAPPRPKQDDCCGCC